MWRRRRWPLNACGADLLPPRHLPLLPISCTQACWAILFISNNTEEPTEHTQMRFELASATLAERIQLGIVAVHEAPEAAAEFLTMETPQIGAADVSRHTAPHLLAATHAACAWPVRSPVQSPRTCRMPVKRCVVAAELALAQATRSAERAHHTLPVCATAGFGKQLGLDPATLGVGQLTQAILSGAAPVAAAFSCQRRTRAHPRGADRRAGIHANPTQAEGDRPSACQKAELTPHASKEEL